MIVDGWVTWAVQKPGIPDKVYSARNTGEWITCHSVVGEESEFEDGIPNRFLDTSKNPDGSYTDYAAASCMFILRLNGSLIQMYPVWSSTWTSGGAEANTRSWAIEAEGGLYPNYGEKLTPMQKQTFIRLVREWETYTGIKAIPGQTLKQHKDVAKQFGYRATACASDRYSEAWAEIASGGNVTMTEEERKMLNDIYKILTGGTPDGVAKFNKWLANGNNLLLGYEEEQKKLAGHRHPTTGPTIFPEVRKNG